MRKTSEHKQRLCVLAYMLLLPLAMIGCIVAVFSVVQASKGNVVLTQVTAQGDASVAHGLELRLLCNADESLFWGVSARFDEQAQAHTVTTHRAYPYGHALSDPTAHEGVNARIDFDVFLDTSSPYEELTPLQQTLRAAYNSMAEGEQREVILNAADYFARYPISVELDLPTLGGAMLKGGGSVEAMFAAAFPIPVHPQAQLCVTLHKQTLPSNVAVSTGVGSAGEIFDFHTVSTTVLTEDGRRGLCYFTFVPVTSGGKPVDLSELPMGYGLYRLYFEINSTGRAEVDPSSLALAVELPPQLRVEHISATQQPTELILIGRMTDEQGREPAYLYRFSAQDARLWQSICLEEDRGESPIRYTAYHKDGYLVLGYYRDGAQFIVLEQDEQGNDRIALRAALPRVEEEKATSPDAHADPQKVNMLQYYDSSLSLDVAYDGKYLAVVRNVSTPRTNIVGGYRRGCDFVLTIHDTAGVQYQGYYKTSLNAEGENFATAVVPNRFAPYQLLWK